MTYEAIKVTNGTVGTLSKVLKEVQEVQNREPSAPDTNTELQFQPGYVTLLKGRFAHKLDATPPAKQNQGRSSSTGKKQSPAIPLGSAPFSSNNAKNNQHGPLEASIKHDLPNEQTDIAFRKNSSNYPTQPSAAAAASYNIAPRKASLPSKAVSSPRADASLTQNNQTTLNGTPPQDAASHHRGADIQNLKRLFEHLANVTESSQTASGRKHEGKPASANGAANSSRSSLIANNRSLSPANHASPALPAYRTTSNSAIANRASLNNYMSLTSSVTMPSFGGASRPASTQFANRNVGAFKRYSDTYAPPVSSKIIVDGDQSPPLADQTVETNSVVSMAPRKTPVEWDKLTPPTAPLDGRKVSIETEALVRIRRAGASWFFGAKVNEKDVPPGCIPFEVSARQADMVSQNSMAQFERLFNLLPTTDLTQSSSASAEPQSAVASDTTDSTSSRMYPASNSRASAGTPHDNDAHAYIPASQPRTAAPDIQPAPAQAQIETQTDSQPRETLRSAPDDVLVTSNNSPPSYVDLAASINQNLSNVDNFTALAQSNVNSSASTGSNSAYALFSALHSETYKNDEDDDDFASSTNEERERKLRDSARRIQIIGANVCLKSALLSDAKRKSSAIADPSGNGTMSARSKEATSSELPVDRNRRISFNDAAITTYEYPSEQCMTQAFEEDADIEGAVDAEDQVDSALKHRFSALFASSGAQNAESILPSYDESTKRNDSVIPARIRFVDDTVQPTTVQLGNEDDEPSSSDDHDPSTNENDSTQRSNALADAAKDASFRSAPSQLLF